MTDEQLQALIQAITRQSPLILDSVLSIESLTVDQLGELYNAIGEHWHKRNVTDDYMPTVGELLKCYEP